MALSYTHLLILLFASTAYMLEVGMANRILIKGLENWNSGFNHTGWPNWNAGSNYTGWAPNSNSSSNHPSWPTWNSSSDHTDWPNWNSSSNYTHSGFPMWNSSSNYTGWPFGPVNATHESRKIVVGGSENWHFGFNYSDWAMNNGPFFYNDTLVFKYDLPSANNTHPHSVYLLPNLRSFLRCDLRRAKRVASTTQGGGAGFMFVLNKWRPHYFACGESNGFHCRSGMKFFVMPMYR